MRQDHWNDPILRFGKQYLMMHLGREFLSKGISWKDTLVEFDRRLPWFVKYFNEMNFQFGRIWESKWVWDNAGQAPRRLLMEIQVAASNTFGHILPRIVALGHVLSLEDVRNLTKQEMDKSDVVVPYYYFYGQAFLADMMRGQKIGITARWFNRAHQHVCDGKNRDIEYENIYSMLVSVPDINKKQAEILESRIADEIMRQGGRRLRNKKEHFICSYTVASDALSDILSPAVSSGEIKNWERCKPEMLDSKNFKNSLKEAAE